MFLIVHSSPLIFLSRLDFLELFVNQDDQFYTPRTVELEINAKQDKASRQVNRLILNQKLMVQDIQLLSLADRLNDRLGRGESEAIALAVELQVDYVILDDFAARKEAKRLGLKVKGTLAIIRKLHQENKMIISDFDAFYQSITAVSFRVKREVFDQIFEN